MTIKFNEETNEIEVWQTEQMTILHQTTIAIYCLGSLNYIILENIEFNN